MKELQPVQPISVDNIKTKIYEFRGQKVMLDFDLASLYQVETKRLKEAVKRNIDRFPEDAMFVLTEDEFASLRSQIATSNKRGVECVRVCENRDFRGGCAVRHYISVENGYFFY